MFSWQMVRDGGIVIFDDYEWTFFADEVERPKLGIDSFLSVQSGQYRELYRGEQVIIQKIGVARNERSAISSRPPPVPREEPVDKPKADGSENDVEFVLIAEAGILEAQALLLCESIRCFAGSYSRSRITAVSPRSSRRPSPSTIDRFEQLGVDYLPIEIDSRCPQYGPSYRVHSLAHVERRTGPPVIIMLDSDAIFIAEPDFSLGTCSAAARPVDSKGMCTTGPGDPFDAYWRQLCVLAGVDYEHLPIVRTSVDGLAVRASYNGGLIAAKRASGLFQRTEDIFRKLVAANMKPWAGAEPTYGTGTGILQGKPRPSGARARLPSHWRPPPATIPSGFCRPRIIFRFTTSTRPPHLSRPGWFIFTIMDCSTRVRRPRTRCWTERWRCLRE
ncbi:hypothetical protein [Mesorhizobium sp. AR02]|uniref:hypothetical protein n=1 Tax=Mesorhizobium sp. AR02 TaxID=2865837 RepID=UPI00216019CC|nr:hypothetical protein [Mesorhizobium sp. AR02]